MPPRLPTPLATTSSLARALVRPFTTTTAQALPPRDHANTHSNRLSNLSQSSSHSHSSSSNSSNSHSSSFGGSRGDAAARLLDRYKAKTQNYMRDRMQQVEFLKNQKISNDYLRQMPRRWRAGDVYSPHDLSPAEMQKWRRKSLRDEDVVDALGINPLDMYKNFSLISHFTSTSGQINHSSITRLRPVNQRKVAKMIRRVQGMGLYPSIHGHPELLRDQFFSRR